MASPNALPLSSRHHPGALTFYGQVFGCAVQLHALVKFGRPDLPAENIAQGHQHDGPVRFFASDAAGNQATFRSEGVMLSLLGAADPATLSQWFAVPADAGRVLEDLHERLWGATDGQVIDRSGLHWLI